MDILDWFLGLLLVGFLILVFWYTRPRPRCSECKSYKVGLTSKEPLGMLGSHIGGRGGTGTTQVRYKVTYCCNNCQATWTTTTTETR